MPRKYQPIWESIKAVKVGQEVPVRCHESSVRTLKNAVLKEKSLETATKKRLAMPFAGNLEIRIEYPTPENKIPPGFVVIYFKLSWDGSRL